MADRLLRDDPTMKKAIMERGPSWRVSDLKQFPDQDKFFPPQSEASLRALAVDIERTGVRRPIEILTTNRAGYPDGTILKGNRRVQAVALLGWTRVEVCGRSDRRLQVADRATIEHEYIKDNVNERPLYSIEQVRAALMMRRIEHSGSTEPSEDDDSFEARQRVVAIIKNSDAKVVGQLLRVLKAPFKVQWAFLECFISLVEADKIARLDRKTQEQIGRKLKDIKKRKEVRAVINCYLLAPPKAHRPLR